MSISFENVYKSFGPKKILEDFSFTVETGEIMFVLGKSGMGKSVTLKTIIGLLKPDSGKVFVDSMPIHKLDENGLADVRKRCGMVFQHPALLDSLTVYENVGFGLRDLSREKARERVLECLKLVHLDESILGRKP